MRARLHLGRAAVLVAALALLAGCEQVASLIPADRLECGGTEPDLCRAVAVLAVEQMNLEATGRITDVVLTPGDCEQTARATFRSELADAVACWRVDVTGEDSHGGGLVGLWPNGDLRAFW